MSRIPALFVLVLPGLMPACAEDTTPSRPDADTTTDAASDVSDVPDVAPDVYVPVGRLVLNEVSCRADPVEWVEVMNVGDAAIDTGGVRVSDDPREAGVRLPQRLLGPGERLVVSGDIGLGCGSDTTYLVQVSRVLDEAPPSRGDDEVSTWGRVPDGSGEFAATAPTPQKPNLLLEDLRASVFDASGPMPIIDLYVDADAENTLISEQKVYAPGLFSWTDGTGTSPVQRVDIRIKGSITMRPWTAKPSLKLHFARHDEPGPRAFRGLKKLALHNLAYDPAAGREWLAYEVMRTLGQPVPRVAWAVVRVNGVSKGLYGVVEFYDEVFLRDHFPSTEALYEADGDFGQGELYGFSLDEGDSMEPLLELAQRVVRVQDGVSQPTDALPEIDWRQVAGMMGLEDLLQHSDGMMAGCHNWFAHVDQSGTWSVLPWSVDLTLIPTWGVVGPLTPCSVLANLCFRDERCHGWFLRARDEAAQRVLRGDFRATLVGLAERAQPHARPKDEPWSSNEFWPDARFDLAFEANRAVDLLETRARQIRCATAAERGVVSEDDPTCGGFFGTTPGGKPEGKPDKEPAAP